MFRQIVLACTFVTALGVVGMMTPQSADAWRWNRGYYGAYYGGPSYYSGPRYYRGYVGPYRTNYPGGAYYRSDYYSPNYGGYYYGPRYYRPAPRVAVRIGW